MAKHDLTAARLRELVRYDPETGHFTRIRQTRHKPAGTRITYIMPNGYERIMVGSHKYPAHRLAWLYMAGEWPTMEIDHINGRPGDNRWCNLRHISRSMNQQNQRKAQRSSKSGLLGVCTRRNGASFYAMVEVNGVSHRSATFKKKEEAHAAYIELKRKLHPGSML
jgi:hypothetical protein